MKLTTTNRVTHKKEFPCPICENGTEHLIMIHHGKVVENSEWWRCPVCGWDSESPTKKKLKLPYQFNKQPTK